MLQAIGLKGFAVNLYLWVDRDELSTVVGSRGKSVQQLQKEYNVHVSVVKKDKYPGTKFETGEQKGDGADAVSLWAPILIQGGMHNAFCACRKVQQRVEDIDDLVVELPIDKGACSIFFENGVDSIKRISADTCSRIYIPCGLDESDTMVLVEAGPDNAEKACIELLKTVGLEDNASLRGSKSKESASTLGKKKMRRGNRNRKKNSGGRNDNDTSKGDKKTNREKGGADGRKAKGTSASGVDNGKKGNRRRGKKRSE